MVYRITTIWDAMVYYHRARFHPFPDTNPEHGVVAEECAVSVVMFDDDSGDQGPDRNGYRVNLIFPGFSLS